MRISFDIKVLYNTLLRIKEIAETTQNPNYVMMKFSSNNVRVITTDGIIAYFEDMDVETIDGDDIAGILEINRLFSIVSSDMPSNGLEVEPIIADVNENDISFYVTKYVSINDEKRIVSETSHKIVNNSITDRKFMIFGRVNYDEIDNENKDYDEYDTNELINAISKMASDNKETNVYISAKGFVRSRGTITIKIVKIPQSKYNICMKYAFANKVANVFSKLGTQNMYINASDDNRMCTMTDDNRKCYLWFEITHGLLGDKATFEAIEKIEFNNVKMRVCKPALLSGIDAIKLSDTEQAIISIVNNNGDYAIKIETTKNTSNIDNEVSIIIDRLEAKDGVDPTKFKAVVQLSEWKSILSRCENNWVMIAFSDFTSNAPMRICDTRKVVGFVSPLDNINSENASTNKYEEYANYYMGIGMSN